jgi:chaperonin cofactor prefoldin
MTVNATDMSTPVTRGELRAELERFEIRFEQLEIRLEQKLEQKLAHLATRAELEIWGGALLARIESGEQRMSQRFDSFEQRLLSEFARHANAVQETLSTQISVIDDKYVDLPPRVSRLENAVFVPKER